MITCIVAEYHLNLSPQKVKGHEADKFQDHQEHDEKIYYWPATAESWDSMIDEIKKMNGREVMNNIRKTGLSVMGWCRKNDICYETTLAMLQGHPRKRDVDISAVILEKLKEEGHYVGV
jgi:hypothetical protein